MGEVEGHSQTWEVAGYGRGEVEGHSQTWEVAGYGRGEVEGQACRLEAPPPPLSLHQRPSPD